MDKERMPKKVEPTKPPALKEEVSPPALLATSNIDAALYFDYLDNTNRDLEQLLQSFTNLLQETKVEVESSFEVPPLLQEAFPNFTKKVSVNYAPDSALFAAGSVLAKGLSQGVIAQEEFDLLLGQTKTWGNLMHLEKFPFLHLLFQKGLAAFDNPNPSICFPLRQMLLMILVNHPKVLESVVSKELAPLLVSDFLADVSNPTEAFDLNTLFVLLSAFGIKCPVYAIEDDELTAFYPSETSHLKKVEGIIIWRGDKTYSVLTE